MLPWVRHPFGGCRSPPVRRQ